MASFAPINWRLIFLVSVPIGLFSTVFGYLKLHETSPKRPARIDWPGNITDQATVNICGGQLLIDPTDEVVVCHIPYKEKQAVCHLIQSAIAQRVAGRGQASKWLGSEHVSAPF